MDRDNLVNKLKATMILDDDGSFLRTSSCKRNHNALEDKELGEIKFLIIGLVDEAITREDVEEKEFIDCIITWTKSEDGEEDALSKSNWISELGYSNILGVDVNNMDYNNLLLLS